MTADKESLLDAVFSAVTLPPVTTSKSIEHSEYHSTIQTSQTFTQSHVESHQVHAVSTVHVGESIVSAEHHHEDFHESEDEVTRVKQKLAELAHHDDNDHHSFEKRDSVISQQSNQSIPRSIRAHSTASSHATSHTSEGTLHKIQSAIVERESLTMGHSGSKAESVTSEEPAHSIPKSTTDHSRSSSIGSRQSEKSLQSLNSHQSHHSHGKETNDGNESDGSDSTITPKEHGYHNDPQIRAAVRSEPSEPVYDEVPEITEEIVLEDSHGRILSREEEFPDYPPPPPPQQGTVQEAPRSPVPVDLLSDLRNHRIYQQNMPDDDTSTTISEARVESILGAPKNGLKEDSDSSDDELNTIVVLRSIVKRDFDSSQVIAVENPAIKRTASQVKPLDEKLKTELQAAMQTRAIEDDSSSSTLSQEDSVSQKNATITAGVFVHRDASIEDHGHRESVIRHEDHELENHAKVEHSHLVHLEQIHQETQNENSNPPEPDHWEPRRFSHSSNESQGFEHPVYREHHHDADHSDDEATLTSHDGVQPVKSSEYHIEPLVTSLRKDDDYPTYLHRGSVSSKASSMTSDGYRPSIGNGGYVNQEDVHSIGSGAQVQHHPQSHPNNQLPHLDPIPAGGYSYRRDTSISQASLADSERSSGYHPSVNRQAPPPAAPAQVPSQVYPTSVQPALPGGYQRQRGMSKDNYSTVSSIALIPNLYDQPKVTEKLRPVRAQDVLKTLEKEKPVELRYEEPVYDEVYEDLTIRSHNSQQLHHEHQHHHAHHEDLHHHQHHDHHEHHHQAYQPPPQQQQYITGNNVLPPVREPQPPHYAGSVNSDGFVHVKKPLRPSRHEHHLPYGDHFVLQEGVNTLRGRWERGAFRNHEETESERNYALHHLSKAIGSSTSSVNTKSRSATTTSQASQGTVTSKRSQAKSEVSAASAPESVASKRSKQSIPQLQRTGGGYNKSRTSTLQHIDENEELHVPRSLDELRVDVSPGAGPVLAQAPVTSPAYNEKFQSLRVVKSVRQFVQQWSQPNQGHNGNLIVYKHPSVQAVQPPQVPQHYAVQSEPIPAPRQVHPQVDSRRNSVQSNATSVSSVSARSSVSQQSARLPHKEVIHSHHDSVASLKTVSKPSSVIGSLARGQQSNGTNTRSGSQSIQSEHLHQHESAAIKRQSIDSQSTITHQSVNNQQLNGHHENHFETPISPAFEEHPVTEVKIRAETHVLTELVPVSQRRALFESNDQNEIHRNYSINRKNIQHDHLPPMVNVLE